MFIVFTSAPNSEEAENLAEKIITEKLAACVQILPQMKSIYYWKGELNKDQEYLMLIKTLESTFNELRDFIQENHSYDTPEIIAVESEKVCGDYFNWMTKSMS